MALTPMDIIKEHIDSILDSKWLPDGAPDSAELAAKLNDELRDNFYVIASEEIAAVKVENIGKDYLSAGSGPEEATCGVESNPNWLRNRAVNELALARHLDNGQGIRLPDNHRGRAYGTLTMPDNKLSQEDLTEAMRVAAGAPLVLTPRLPEGTVEVTVRLSGNPMLWYMGTDRVARRLDDETIPGSVGFPSGREAQIALALTDLSANRLHKVTR